jgi:integrase
LRGNHVHRQIAQGLTIPKNNLLGLREKRRQGFLRSVNACRRNLFLKALWDLTDEALDRPYKLALQLLLATCGQRPIEVIGAPLSEFDLEARVWSIPPARTKNKRWHLLPLTDMAIDLIDQVRALHGRKGLHLFPKYGDPDKSGHMSRNVLSRSVQKLCADTDFARFVPRDLRRTVKTRMGELGIAKDVRDRLQNHAYTDVSAKHYDRYDYMIEKRAAAERWCDFLEVTILGGNVVPIKNAGKR